MARRGTVSGTRTAGGQERCINTEYRMQGAGSTRRRGMVQCTLERGHDGLCEQRGMKFAKENGEGVSLSETRKRQRHAAARREDKA